MRGRGKKANPTRSVSRGGGSFQQTNSENSNRITGNARSSRNRCIRSACNSSIPSTVSEYGVSNGYGQRGYADGATLRSVINDPRFQSDLESFYKSSLRLCVLTPCGDSINEIFPAGS
ncbi:hypothetical protein RND71_017382 [Anisodus tanguticus]|uniref:Uncharacterized protein n=1 Tax=Anisodus tanguticus TaxID=243964 RepID=A0AAE1VFY7_9SOLA|nr:hypothetical protein RND71_017382 [Anisodus tanguticus]